MPGFLHFDFITPDFLSQLNLKTETAFAVLEIVIIYAVLRMALRRIISKIVVPILANEQHIPDPRHAARLKTLAGLLNSVISYTLSFVFGVMLLQAVHLDPVPLLTTASVAGLAVGFGAQKLVKDVISGFFILLENQYAIGDYVTIGTVTGTVEEVGMRTTRIKDDLGRLYILSNGDITQVCNQSRGPVETFIEIGVAAATDIAQATTIIDEAGKEIAEKRQELGFAQAPVVQGIAAVDAAKITLRVTCQTKVPTRLVEAQLALRGHAREKLAEAGIALA